VTCHRIPRARRPERAGRTAADGIGSRTYIAGVLRNEPDNMIHWLRAPQDINPASAMPDLGVGEQDARDFAAYSPHWTRRVPGPGAVMEYESPRNTDCIFPAARATNDDTAGEAPPAPSSSDRTDRTENRWTAWTAAPPKSSTITSIARPAMTSKPI